MKPVRRAQIYCLRLNNSLNSRLLPTGYAVRYIPCGGQADVRKVLIAIHGNFMIIISVVESFLLYWYELCMIPVVLKVSFVFIFCIAKFKFCFLF